jgi:hypothetical protein
MHIDEGWTRPRCRHRRVRLVACTIVFVSVLWLSMARGPVGPNQHDGESATGLAITCRWLFRFASGKDFHVSKLRGCRTVLQCTHCARRNDKPKESARRFELGMICSDLGRDGVRR